VNILIPKIKFEKLDDFFFVVEENMIEHAYFQSLYNMYKKIIEFKHVQSNVF
jgi:hypothetical protein